jgi:hypothetical protein
LPNDLSNASISLKIHLQLLPLITHVFHQSAARRGNGSKEPEPTTVANLFFMLVLSVKVKALVA